MALSATTISEVESGGSDTANGGLFDPGQTAGMLTDGTATSATGNAPVFSSVSYNFVAGDAGAWVYVASGTNWTAGWYKIASVSANAATLNATIGAAVTAAMMPSTVAGCATTASPTGATWAIDYSQQSTVKYTYTDLASTGAGLTVSSALSPFNKEQVGNCIVITGGTNFTTGRYVIASVAANVATVVGAGNITSGVGALGTGGQGGAFATPGAGVAPLVAGNKLWIASATYTLSTTSTNVAGGPISLSVGSSTRIGFVISGYGTVRGDFGRPTISAGSQTTFTMITFGTQAGVTIDSLIFDANNGAAVKCINSGTGADNRIIRTKAMNAKSNGISAGGSCLLLLCEITGCSSVSAISLAASGIVAMYCYSHDNTGVNGFLSTVDIVTYIGCISDMNSIGFNGGASTLACINCVAYANSSHGFSITGVSERVSTFLNCIASGNTGAGFSTDGVGEAILENCAAVSNTAGNYNTANILRVYGFQTLSGDPFVDAPNGNFALNNTAGAGTQCRAAGMCGVFPGALTTGYIDIGAAQHQDPASTGTIIYNLME